MKNKISAFFENTKCSHRLIFMLSAASLFYIIPKKYLEEIPFCIFKIIFHVDCIGCGTTRAFWSILHLQFREALAYNRLSIIAFSLLVCCVVHWVFKKKN